MNSDYDKLASVADTYRQLAAEAREAAEGFMPDKYREAYRKMAQHWADLAHEVEECLGWPPETLH
jgi:hypothetical protein